MGTEQKFLERDLEDIIMDNLESVANRGLTCKFYKNTERQFTVSNLNNRIDIFSYEIIDDILHCIIFELKRNELNWGAIEQAHTYLYKIIRQFEGVIKGIRYEIILIGKDDGIGLYNDCIWGLRNVRLFEYDYKIDGIYFTETFNTTYDAIDEYLGRIYTCRLEERNTIKEQV